MQLWWTSDCHHRDPRLLIRHPALPKANENADSTGAGCRSYVGPPEVYREGQVRLFAMKKSAWRALIEVAFIIFLFYSNLLMGEFERSGMGQKRGLAWAIQDVLTTRNFEIAMIAALVGFSLVEFLRRKF